VGYNSAKCLSARGQRVLRGAIFTGKAFHARCHGLYRIDGTDALSRTPDIAPGFGIRIAARPEIHLGRFALWQVVGIARPQAMAPDSATSPSNQLRISCINANGESVPA